MAKEAENRPQYTLVATVERMDNGALLTIKQRAHGGDTIVLKKVYLDPTLLLKDLADGIVFTRAGA